MNQTKKFTGYFKVSDCQIRLKDGKYSTKNQEIIKILKADNRSLEIAEANEMKALKIIQNFLKKLKLKKTIRQPATLFDKFTTNYTSYDNEKIIAEVMLIIK